MFNFIGCDFYFDDTYIGIVEDIVTFSGNDLLLVKTNEGKEHYIPINKKLIKGKFYNVKIKEAYEYDVLGSVLNG